MPGLEEEEDADGLDYDLTWFEARYPMVFRPIRACRGAFRVIGRVFRLMCCSFSFETGVAAFIILAFWAVGLGMLWHLGFLQPILKTLVVYLYFLAFFVIFIALMLMEAWKRVSDKVETGFEVARAVHDYTQDLLGHFGVEDKSRLPRRMAFEEPGVAGQSPPGRKAPTSGQPSQRPF